MNLPINPSAIAWMKHPELANAIEATIQELDDLRTAYRNNRGYETDPGLRAAIGVEIANFNALMAEQQWRNAMLLASVTDE